MGAPIQWLCIAIIVCWPWTTAAVAGERTADTVRVPPPALYDAGEPAHAIYGFAPCAGLLPVCTPVYLAAPDVGHRTEALKLPIPGHIASGPSSSGASSAVETSQSSTLTALLFLAGTAVMLLAWLNSRKPRRRPYGARDIGDQCSLEQQDQTHGRT